MSDSSPKLVQFMHPGAEHGPDEKGGAWKTWNRGTHRRKFLQARGTYQRGRSSPATEADLTFWGEWEAQSEVSPLAPTAPDEPRWLHRPRLQPLDDYTNAQNTDPFVFGDAFLYTCCKQFLHSGAPTQLNSLSTGSVLLFGSYINGDFGLDTVFVVGGTTEHMTSADAERKVTKSYWNTTVRPMYEMDPTAYSSNQAPWRLYRGATPKRPTSGMFSFVPARPATSRHRLEFARPVIELRGLITPSLKQGQKLTPLNEVEMRRYWAAVVDQVLQNDLVLATAFRCPSVEKETPTRGEASSRSARTRC